MSNTTRALVPGEVYARNGLRVTHSSAGPAVISGTGNPNGSQSATIGTLYMRTDAAELWQNTNGATAWALITTSTSDAVVFDAVADRINIRSNRLTNQSPVDDEKVGITNFGSGDPETWAGAGAAADYATIGGGNNNQALGAASTVPGGQRNWAQGVASVAMGEWADASRESQITVASGSFSSNDGPGAAQTSVLVLRGEPINVRSAEYYLDLTYGMAGATSISLQSDRAYAFRITATISGNDGIANLGASITRDLFVLCDASGTTTIETGTQTVTGAAVAVANWSIEGVVNGVTTPESLFIRFVTGGDHGLASTLDMYVAARVEFVECPVKAPTPP